MQKLHWMFSEQTFFGKFSTITMTSCGEKLEDCEVCGKNKAKYTCPKCEVRSCSLTCSNIHKKELECDGIRDKTKFLPITSMTDLDLINDYCLLQEVGRSVDKYNRDPLKRCTTLNNFLPIYLRKLKSAAFRRGVNLEFMPRSFSKNKQNTTRFIWKKNELLWRIDWIFPQAENIKWVTERASENARLSVLLENVLDPEMKAGESPDVLSLKSTLRKKLQFYRSASLSGIKVLMKAEKVQKSDCRFYELDLTLTLTENFEQKTIIEYPTLYVILNHNSDMYEIIDCDVEEEKGVHHHKYPYNSKRNYKNDGKPPNGDFKQNENGIQNPVEETENDPINFLFHTEFSDSEDEKTKAEKKKNVKMQPRKRKPRRNQKEKIQKFQKIRASVNQFTGICKSDSEDEIIAKHAINETVLYSEIESSELVTINGCNLANGKTNEIKKPLTNYFLDSHITDSEDEAPEEKAIQRLASDENEKSNEEQNSKKSESTYKNKKNIENKSNNENRESNPAIQSVAMHYFSAYMSDSEDETFSENTLNTGNSGLQIPDYNDIIKMKH